MHRRRIQFLENPPKSGFKGQKGHIYEGPGLQLLHEIFFEDPSIFHPYIGTFQKIWVLITAADSRT